MPTQEGTNDSLIQIVALLKEAHSILLSGHQNPDADVIGSQLALASMINRMDPKKSVTIANAGAPPPSLGFLEGFKKVRNVDRLEDRFDLVVVFECSGQERMGHILDLATQANQVINIDHHLHNPNYGHVNFVEPETSSTAELVFKIFQAARLPISLSEATCLFTGIVSDTGWFRYGNTTPQTLEIAAQLLKLGIDIAHLSEKIYLSRTEAAMRLLGWALSDLKLHHQNRIAVLTIPQDIFEKMGAQPEDLEEIVNHGLKIETVQISILFKERKTQSEVKVSFRSKGEVDINRLARSFGGGGHRNASGCTVPGKLKDVQEKILNEARHIL